MGEAVPEPKSDVRGPNTMVVSPLLAPCHGVERTAATDYSHRRYETTVYLTMRTLGTVQRGTVDSLHRQVPRLRETFRGLGGIR